MASETTQNTGTKHSHWETDIEGEAILDYSSCPQKFAYRWLYDVPEKPPTPLAKYHRAVYRTCLVLVRQKMEKGQPSTKQAEQLWRLHSASVGLGKGATRKNLNGRNSVLLFLTWLCHFQPSAIGLKSVVPVVISKAQTFNVTIESDFTGLSGDRRISVILTRKIPKLMAFMASHDQLSWEAYNLDSGSSAPLKKPADEDAYKAQLHQLQRGMARRIVWPNRDARCSECQWSDICNPRHSSISDLNDPIQRLKTKKRLITNRK